MTANEKVWLEDLWAEWERKEVATLSFAEYKDEESRITAGLSTAGGLTATSTRAVESWKVKYASGDDPMYKTAALHSAIHNTLCPYLESFAKEEGYTGAHIGRQYDVGRAVVQDMDDQELMALLENQMPISRRL